MDNVVENALRQRDKLRHELAEIEQFLKLYHKFSEASEVTQARVVAVTASADTPRAFPQSPARPLEQMWGGDETNQDNGQRPSAVKPPKALTREELRPHIEAVMREAGKPLTRGNLLRKLDQRGTPVGGETDRAKNMGTIMWRLKDQFVNLPGHGYWIKGEPLPSAGYDPTSQPGPGNEALG